jgi:hypothetical protein
MAKKKKKQNTEIIAEEGNVALSTEDSLEDMLQTVRETPPEELKTPEELKAKEAQLLKLAAQLAKKEREITQREIEAENEFAALNLKSLARLNEAKRLIEKDLGELAEQQRDAKEKIDRELADYRERQKEKVEQEMERLRKESEESIAKNEELYRNTFHKRQVDLDSQENALKDEKANLDAQRKQLEESERTLHKQQRDFEMEKEWQEKEAKENEAHRNDLMEKAKKVLVEKYRQENEQLERAKEQLIEENQELRDKIDRMEREKRAAIGLAGRDLPKELERLKELNKQFQQSDAYAYYEDPDKLDRLQKAEELAKETSKRNEKLRSTNLQLIEKANEFDALNLENENKTKVIESLTQTIESENSTIEKLKDELKLYRKDKTTGEERAKVIKNSDIVIAKEHILEDISETQWLAQIEEGCKESGIVFSRRLLYSFHTAMKSADWLSLSILAGVSGTGKSILPRLYAQYGGLYFLMLPVQPDWDSPSSLFGYYNAVDNQFNPTPLLKAMEQFSRGDGRDDMMIVLLDEMNLAHVELYFSDLLSQLEYRQGDDNAYIQVDMGAGVSKYPIPLTKNLLWVGTMNEDETTKTLSDKVIDRSNMITFPRPKTFHRRKNTTLAPAGKKISVAVWRSWLKSAIAFEEEEIAPYKQSVENINEALARVNRAMGHRVWQSMEAYMSNHPLVIGEFQSSSGEDEAARARRKVVLDLAFEEAIAHKVIPKLKGIDTTGDAKANCLDKISQELQDFGIIADFENACNNISDMFVWRSSEYLEPHGGPYEEGIYGQSDADI